MRTMRVAAVLFISATTLQIFAMIMKDILYPIPKGSGTWLERSVVNCMQLGAFGFVPMFWILEKVGLMFGPGFKLILFCVGGLATFVTVGIILTTMLLKGWQAM